ncbi:MAG: hypothetical protein ABIK37_01580 [candidate division WOR-3 bacterium]
MRLAYRFSAMFALSVTAAIGQPGDSSWVSYYNGVDGWFAFQGPQRAMRLHPADFGLRYPFQVESLKTWWYWGMGSRQDTVFTFRIYEGDGVSLLWESESLTAPVTNWSNYGLAQPVVIDSGDFWIATTHRLVNPYAHPYVNVDTGPTNHSYYGTPGSWTLDNVGEFCFFAFVREVGVGAREGRWSGGPPAVAPATLARGVLRLQSGTALLDAAGREVAKLHSGANDVRRLSTGVYFVRSSRCGAVFPVAVLH